MVDFHDALSQLVILGVNEVESALRSYEGKTTAKQHESANSEMKIGKKIFKMQIENKNAIYK